MSQVTSLPVPYKQTIFIKLTNNCINFEKEREEIINKLNNLDTYKINKTLMEIIEYYYNNRISESKYEKKMIIKEFN